MKTLSLFLLGACLVGAQTLTPKTPYVMDSNGIYYIPSANMQSTTYTRGTSTFDARPCGGTANTISYTPIEGSPIVCETSTSFTSFTAGYVNSGTNTYSFVGNPLIVTSTTLAGSTSHSAAVDGVFTCGATSGVTSYGAGCGIYIISTATNRLYTMSYYNTTSGNSLIVQTWCYDPAGSACGGSTVPVWQNNDLGVYPINNGVQSFRISSTWQPNVLQTATILFQYTLDGGFVWNTIASKGFDYGVSGGVFANTGTTMSILALGGLN